MRASGVTLSRCAACDVISTRADAASFRVLALPAVTVPYTRMWLTSIMASYQPHDSSDLILKQLVKVIRHKQRRRFTRTFTRKFTRWRQCDCLAHATGSQPVQPFVRAHGSAPQTDRQTTECATCVAVGRVYAVHVMRPLTAVCTVLVGQTRIPLTLII